MKQIRSSANSLLPAVCLGLLLSNPVSAASDQSTGLSPGPNRWIVDVLAQPPYDFTSIQ